jgi:hypothetical protein
MASTTAQPRSRRRAPVFQAALATLTFFVGAVVCDALLEVTAQRVLCETIDESPQAPTSAYAACRGTVYRQHHCVAGCGTAGAIEPYNLMSPPNHRPDYYPNGCKPR